MNQFDAELSADIDTRRDPFDDGDDFIGDDGLCAGDYDPEKERRVLLMAERYERGLDLYTGQPRPHFEPTELELEAAVKDGTPWEQQPC